MNRNRWERGAGFRIVGVVARKPFVVASGKCAFLELAVPGRKGKEVKHELRAFDYDMIMEVAALGAGQVVQVTGVIDREPLQFKIDGKYQNAQHDGKDVWVSKHTIRAIAVEGAVAQPKDEQRQTAKPAPVPPSEAYKGLDDAGEGDDKESAELF